MRLFHFFTQTKRKTESFNWTWSLISISTVHLRSFFSLSYVSHVGVYTVMLLFCFLVISSLPLCNTSNNTPTQNLNWNTLDCSMNQTAFIWLSHLYIIVSWKNKCEHFGSASLSEQSFVRPGTSPSSLWRGVGWFYSELLSPQSHKDSGRLSATLPLSSHWCFYYARRHGDQHLHPHIPLHLWSSLLPIYVPPKLVGMRLRPFYWLLL